MASGAIRDIESKFEIRNYITIIIASVIAGFCIYLSLSYLHVISRISIPISVSISVLIFGLSMYYTNISLEGYQKKEIARPFKNNSGVDSDHDNNNGNISNNNKKEYQNYSNFVFIIIYTVLILISVPTEKQDFHVFINWNEIGITGIIQLGSAIMLTFFIPGYAIVLIIRRKYQVVPVLSVLLAYLLSLLVTGLTAYIFALSFDIPLSDGRILLIEMHLIILFLFLTYYIRDITKSGFKLPELNHNSFLNSANEFIEYMNVRRFELLVYGSLLTIVIVSTYVLYGGVTIGDQRYHQGRALLFMTGSIREAALFGSEDLYYPPFQSAILAGLTTLSGIPMVNSYASIAFLNAVTMFAFYYFFVNWVPGNQKKAVLLACSLFILSSGFGWAYLFNTALTHPITSETSSLSRLGTIADLDIINATNFVIPTAPELRPHSYTFRYRQDLFYWR